MGIIGELKALVKVARLIVTACAIDVIKNIRDSNSKYIINVLTEF